MLQELTQEIERTVRSMINEVHTALPGKIVSFDVEKGLATVKPIGKFITSNKKVLEYPELSEVPFVFPYSNQAEVGMFFPVKVGDICLIIISEVELDEWRNGAESEGSLRFDLTNAIVIPSLLKSDDRLLECLSESSEKSAVIIATTDSKVLVSKDNIEIFIGESKLSALKDTIEILVGESKISVAKDNTRIVIGNTEFIVSNLGITARGDFSVEGNLTCSGTLKSAECGNCKCEEN